MTDKKIAGRPLLRGTSSRKSGHTCTVCGSIFGLRASLAEHKEIHYYPHKTTSGHLVKKSEKKRTTESQNLVDKVNILGNKRARSSSTALVNDDNQNSQHLSHSYKSSIWCKENGRTIEQKCGSVVPSEPDALPKGLKKLCNEYTDHVSTEQVSVDTVKANNTPSALFNRQLHGLHSNAISHQQLRKVPNKGHTEEEGIEYLVCLLSDRDEMEKKCFETKEISADLETVEGGSSVSKVENEMQSSTLSGRGDRLESNFTSECGSTTGKEKVNLQGSRKTDDEKETFIDAGCSIGGKLKTELVASVLESANSPGEPNKLALSGGEVPGHSGQNDHSQVWYSLNPDAEGKFIPDGICTQTSFTISREELLDVEEEIVLTGHELDLPCGNSMSHQNTTIQPSKATPKLSLDKVMTSESQVVVVLKAHGLNIERPRVPMVSLLKSNLNSDNGCLLRLRNPSVKRVRESRRKVKGCILTSIPVSRLLTQGQTQMVGREMGSKRVVSSSSPLVSVKRTLINDKGAHSIARQMISLLSKTPNSMIAAEHHSDQQEIKSNCVASTTATTQQQSPAMIKMAECLSTSDVNKNQETSSDESSSFVISQNTKSPVSAAYLPQNPGEVFASKKTALSRKSLSDLSHRTVSSGILCTDSKSTVKIHLKEEIVETKFDTDLISSAESQIPCIEQNGKNCVLFHTKKLSDSSSDEKLQSLVWSSGLSLSECSDTFRCPLCFEDFSDELKLSAHRTAQHVCSLCDREFKQPSNLRKHQRVNHELYRPHRCDICSKRFPYQSSLKEHKLVHVEGRSEKAHTCEVCGKTFTRASGLRKHSKEEHLEVKPYVCLLCQKSFAYLCSLKAHMKTHSMERPFKCDACGQTFKQSSNLNKHIRLHHRAKCGRCHGNCICDQDNRTVALSGKSTVCEVCGRACEGQKQLTIHMRVHTGEKPEVCDACGKSFQHKSNLQKHQLKHSGDKPYVCKFCCRAFYANHSLLSHMRLHTGESPFLCNICGKRFCTKNGLQVHSLLHSNVRPFACSVCNKTFTQLGNLNKHMSLHTGERPFTCPYCDKGFVDSSALKRHVVKHGGARGFPCPTCGEKFHFMHALRSHELVHAGRRQEAERRSETERFFCPVCDKCFVNRPYYMRHLKRHHVTTAAADEVVLNPGECIVYLTE